MQLPGAGTSPRGQTGQGACTVMCVQSKRVRRCRNGFNTCISAQTGDPGPGKVFLCLFVAAESVLPVSACPGSALSVGLCRALHFCSTKSDGSTLEAAHVVWVAVSTSNPSTGDRGC